MKYEPIRDLLELASEIAHRMLEHNGLDYFDDASEFIDILAEFDMILAAPRPIPERAMVLYSRMNLHVAKAGDQDIMDPNSTVLYDDADELT